MFILEEFIKLNVTTGMLMKNVKHVESDIKDSACCLEYANTKYYLT